MHVAGEIDKLRPLEGVGTRSARGARSAENNHNKRVGTTTRAITIAIHNNHNNEQNKNNKSSLPHSNSNNSLDSSNSSFEEEDNNDDDLASVSLTKHSSLLSSKGGNANAIDSSGSSVG